MTELRHIFVSVINLAPEVSLTDDMLSVSTSDSGEAAASETTILRHSFLGSEISPKAVNNRPVKYLEGPIAKSYARIDAVKDFFTNAYTEVRRSCHVSRNSLFDSASSSITLTSRSVLQSDGSDSVDVKDAFWAIFCQPRTKTRQSRNALLQGCFQ